MGFTLIELVISAAIIAIISAIVILRFSAFDSSVLLKALAYDVAASIRDAQVYSVSVVRNSDSFDYPYGVSFTPSAGSTLSKTYTFFRFANADVGAQPQNSVADGESINVYTIPRSMHIADVCLVRTEGGVDVEYCDITRLDISFRRPEFKALFYAENWPAGVPSDTISSARIKVSSTANQGEVWVVEVGALGHISVKKGGT